MLAREPRLGGMVYSSPSATQVPFVGESFSRVTLPQGAYLPHACIRCGTPTYGAPLTPIVLNHTPIWVYLIGGLCGVLFGWIAYVHGKQPFAFHGALCRGCEPLLHMPERRAKRAVIYAILAFVLAVALPILGLLLAFTNPIVGAVGYLLAMVFASLVGLIHIMLTVYAGYSLATAPIRVSEIRRQPMPHGHDFVTAELRGIHPSVVAQLPR